MSITIQQIITDAKRLAGRLKERDSVADVLLNETHAINKKIDAMKQVSQFLNLRVSSSIDDLFLVPGGGRTVKRSGSPETSLTIDSEHTERKQASTGDPTGK